MHHRDLKAGASFMDVNPIIGPLNEAQREAVTAPAHEPALVLAGAGSGKTRVLVHRIAWLCAVEGLSPFGILAVTFTNKAAAEMRGRTETLLGLPPGGMWVGTFHGIAHRLLRMHHAEAELPETFQILDSDDQLRLIRRTLRALALDEKQWIPRQVQWFINARKDEGLRPGAIADTGDYARQQLVRIYAAYEEICRQSGLVDFAELLLRSVELLRDHPELLSHYRRRFRHVLVDEFQDTNALQYQWLQLLSGGEVPVFAVGDDDQSIYGWRGARVEHIQAFPRDFPRCRIYRLEQNYRSTATILKAANHLIRFNADRMGKSLWTEGEEGPPILLYGAFNERDEARFVVERIQQLVADEGLRRADVAVLYRSNAQSRLFEERLMEQGIPYRVYGGLRFFERLEIKDALAYLRLSVNRHDDASFERVVNQPTRGIGERTLQTIRDTARERGVSLWTAAELLRETGGLPTRAGNALHRFIELVEAMAEAREGLPLFEQVARVIELSGLQDHYLKEGEAGRTRVENLEELVNAARGFDFDPQIHGEMSDVDAFLAHAALEAGEGQGGRWEDCVQLMTLHAAKGLEFPVVFITGLEEGLFPNARSLDEPGRLEEERRLCYVGLTRAQRRLILSYAQSRRIYGRDHVTEPSRFLDELPSELIQDLRPPVQVRPLGRSTGTTAHSNRLRGTESAFRIGERVRHQGFGEGVIVDCEGQGASARVQVRFDGVGSKWLVLEYAGLQRVG